MDNVPELIEEMRSKMLLLEEAAATQELIITRLRKDADNMEDEQDELRALQSELAMNVNKAELYWKEKLSQDALNKAALDEFMRNYQ